MTSHKGKKPIPDDLSQALLVLNRFLESAGVELHIVATAIRRLDASRIHDGTDDPQWLDLAEAKQLSGRSRDTLQLWHADGKIFARKQAGRWEYDRRSLLRHLAGSK